MQELESKLNAKIKLGHLPYVKIKHILTYLIQFPMLVSIFWLNQYFAVHFIAVNFRR